MAKVGREFQLLVKPIAAVCNIDCHYCYYLEKKDLYPGSRQWRMPDDLLENYIIQHIEAASTEVILFSWHGGEPTVLGVDYFRKVVELQRKHRPSGRQILNGLQTNGTLLDDEWFAFFAAEKFFVGLSMDGPQELHDANRVTRSGKPTHERVMQSYRGLKAHGVSCDLLCVVSSANVRHPEAVYRFFKSIGADYVQFLPIVRRAPGGALTPESVPAREYGTFLKTVFDDWVRNDIGRIGVQNFDEALRTCAGMEHALCIFRKTCGDVAAIEHNGDFYNCDHFVDRAHKLGNIREQSITELLEHPAQIEFGRRKADLPRYCRECSVRDFCNGGCPKDRFIETPDGEAGLNYLCAGFKSFFTYSRPYLRRLAACQKSGSSIEEFMRSLRAEDNAPTQPAGRNDPCPCGSGKKFKKCCLAKRRALA